MTVASPNPKKSRSSKETVMPGLSDTGENNSTSEDAKATPSDDIRSEDFSALIPLHHRLYIVLRQRLIDRTYPTGNPLPGENHLAVEFSVSRVTIRRTLKRLQNEGMIRRLAGAGTFPTVEADRLPHKTQDKNYYDYLSRKSQEYDDLLLKFEYIDTPSFLSQQQTGFGRRVLKVERLCRYQGAALHLLRSYIPGDLGSLISSEGLGSTPLLTMLERQGILTERSELTLSATSADNEVGRHLGVPFGSPLLYAIRVSWDDQQRPVEFNESLSRPDFYGLRLDITRGQDGMKLEWPRAG